MINEVKSKRKKPCKECPFNRVNILEGDKPGGSDVTVYIGQIQGPFWLPCHMDKNYEGKKSDPSCVDQCAGAAIFRSNLKDKGLQKYGLPKSLMFLEADHNRVFSSFEEFYAHYKNVSLSQAKEILTEDKLEELLIEEIAQV
jgi:hypothetical protein